MAPTGTGLSTSPSAVIIACPFLVSQARYYPNIGYGSHTIKYADGTTREFYQIGISANKTGISVYILGIKDKKYLAQTYGKQLRKASVTGYCIRFKTLKDINIDVLEAAIRYGVEAQNEKCGLMK